MAKTRLSNEKRIGLLNYMMTVWKEKNRAALQQTTIKAVAATNVAIRKKYPENDMKVLEKYNCTRKDGCLRFTILGTGQVFGVEFFPRYNVIEDIASELAPVPTGRGCSNNDVFVISETGKKAIESFTAAKEKYNDDKAKKRAEYRAFLDVCKYVEEVDEVVPLTEELKKRYMSGAPLVAANPELVEQIRQEFSKAG